MASDHRTLAVSSDKTNVVLVFHKTLQLRRVRGPGPENPFPVQGIHRRNRASARRIAASAQAGAANVSGKGSSRDREKEKEPGRRRLLLLVGRRRSPARRRNGNESLPARASPGGRTGRGVAGGRDDRQGVGHIRRDRMGPAPRFPHDAMPVRHRLPGSAVANQVDVAARAPGEEVAAIIGFPIQPAVTGGTAEQVHDAIPSWAWAAASARRFESAACEARSSDQISTFLPMPTRSAARPIP